MRERTLMRSATVHRTSALVAGLAAALALACTTLIDFPDLPDFHEGGVADTGVTPRHDGGRPDATTMVGRDAATEAAFDVGSGSASSSASSSSSGSGSESGSGSGSGSESGSSAASSSSSANVVPPPSCAVADAGTSSCGATSESCCATAPVASGTFDRVYTRGDAGVAEAGAPAAISSFHLDKYAVTVGRFRQYVNYVSGMQGNPPIDGMGKHVHLNGGQGLVNDAPGVPDAGVVHESGWDSLDWGKYIVTGPSPSVRSTWNSNLECTPPEGTWTATPGANENRPINCVNWYESYAFCIWDGGFLPTEAEWEYAAAGGSEQRKYPWGTTYPGTGTQFAIYNCNYPSSSMLCPLDGGNLAPVGLAAMGVGKWGQFDLVGDVYEWTLDWYAPFGASPVVNDPAYLTPYTTTADGGPAFASRIRRGATFNDNGTSLHPWVRTTQINPTGPTARSVTLGVRCARGF